MRAPSKVEIDRELCRRSLKAFVVKSWHVHEAGSYMPTIASELMINRLERVSAGEFRKLIINLPPRHLKSKLVSVLWPAWDWIEHPERRFLYASHKLSLTERDSSAWRDLIENDWYQSHFGDCFTLSVSQNSKGRIENDHRGHRIATSVGASATGEGGDFIVIDDPLGCPCAVNVRLPGAGRRSELTRGHSARRVSSCSIFGDSVAGTDGIRAASTT
jgi:hypothetical protein